MRWKINGVETNGGSIDGHGAYYTSPVDGVSDKPEEPLNNQAITPTDAEASPL